jgi:transposase
MQSAITHVFAGVAVSDLDASIDWYTRFLGRLPDMRAGEEILWEVDEHATLFRLRVLGAVDAGTPREEVAETFSVSMPTIKRWIKRRRETGDVEPRAIPGRPSRKGTMLERWLPEHLQENDDLTLEEHREAFEEEFGERVSTSTIGRSISGLPDGAWPLKKSPR